MNPTYRMPIGHGLEMPLQEFFATLRGFGFLGCVVNVTARNLDVCCDEVAALALHETLNENLDVPLYQEILDGSTVKGLWGVRI